MKGSLAPPLIVFGLSAVIIIAACANPLVGFFWQGIGRFAGTVYTAKNAIYVAIASGVLLGGGAIIASGGHGLNYWARRKIAKLSSSVAEES